MTHKRKSLIIPFLCIILTALFFSCSDDDSTTGTLNISFANSTSNVEIWIYSSEDSTTPIYTSSLNGNKELSITLNIGNYFVQPHSTSQTYYPKAGFQMQVNKRTSIKYDERNDVTVQNE
ncbi:hypothetical protein [Dysgonomonas capnocytophagoides]|uniref:hypothetical protein n=1 Tax=Dysgonomonas capnocytophagoides TaxID=45254 RepID=UPI00333FD2D7